MHLRNNTILVFCIALALLVSSCGTQPYFEENYQVPTTGWNSDSTLEFKVHITNTYQPYNFFINIRQQGDYAYQNLWVFIKTLSPKKQLQDTLEFVLANNDGKWLGNSASGNLWENKILFRRNFQFPDTGTYHFTIEQAMRDSMLLSMKTIGLRIEEYK